MIRIKITSFTELNNSDFCKKAQEIHDRLSDNPSFPTPTIPMTDLQKVINDFRLLESKACKDHSYINKRNAQRGMLTGMLLELASYVTFVVRNAQNPDLMVRRTGFILSNLKIRQAQTGYPTKLSYRSAHDNAYCWNSTSIPEW